MISLFACCLPSTGCVSQTRTGVAARCQAVKRSACPISTAPMHGGCVHSSAEVRACTEDNSLALELASLPVHLASQRYERRV